MTTILTVEKLQEIAPITNALANQVEMLTSFIEVSEIMHLKEDILGEALYDEIISNIENGVWSGSNQTLTETYLYSLSSWYCFWESLPFIMWRSEAKGLTKKFSDNSQPLDKDEFAEYRQAVLDKAIFYRNATIKYLQNNSTIFPLWRTKYFSKTVGTGTLDDCNDCDGFGGVDSSTGIYIP